jgi:outer membrane immunogenic protein
MRRVALALTATAVVSLAANSFASAADVPVKAPRIVTPVAAPVYNWTGFYAGLNGGYGWNRNSVELTGDDPTSGAGNFVLNCVFQNICFLAPAFAYAAYSQPLHLQGAFGGGQLGYNWQFSKNWVAGLEADVQSGMKGEASKTSGRPDMLFGENASQHLHWFGTMRGRLGFLATERFLVFGTGGLGYGQTKVSASFTNLNAFGVTPLGNTTFACPGSAVCLAGSDTKTSIGWTAGGGVEWAVWNNISLKAEYLHVDLGDQTLRLVTQPPNFGNAFVVARFDNSFDIVRFGLNLRL